MGASTMNSPGVYSVEKDISQIIDTATSSIGAIVIAARQGPRGPILITSEKDFVNTYFVKGKPDPDLGPSVYCALDFLTQGRNLWVYNVGDGSNYGLLILKVLGDDPYTPSLMVNSNVRTIADLDLYPYGDNLEHACLIYGKSPGVFAGNYSVDITNVYGTLKDIVVTKGGSGYTTSGATVLITPALGDTPTVAATAVLTRQTVAPYAITGVTITNSGAGYTRPPTITIVPDPDSAPTIEAKATCRLNDLPGFELRVFKTSGTDKSSVVPVETWRVSLRSELWTVGKDQKQIFIEDVINDPIRGSKIIKVATNPNNDNIRVNRPVSLTALINGTGASYPSNSDVINGWGTFSDVETIDVNILLNGGFATPSVHQAMMSLAESRKDCFAVLDMPSDRQQVMQAIAYTVGSDSNAIGANPSGDVGEDLNTASSYAGIYTPDYKRLDPYTDAYVWIPPSGVVGAAMVYTDYVRDPWWAPAGLNRGLVKGLGLRYKYNLGDRDALYEENINALRIVRGSGIVIWGNRTLNNKFSALSSVHIRRMLLVIEKSISIFLNSWVFEPNDEFTRLQITAVCTAFLQDIQRRRGLYAFRVVCDETNNSPQTIDQNILYVDVYVQPTRAAEFIQLTTVITRTGADFNEYIARGGAATL